MPFTANILEGTKIYINLTLASLRNCVDFMFEFIVLHKDARLLDLIFFLTVCTYISFHFVVNKDILVVFLKTSLFLSLGPSRRMSKIPS